MSNARPDSSFSGDLELNHLLQAAGVDLGDVVVLRHTYSERGLRSAADLVPEKIFAWVSEQSIGGKIGSNPPRFWVNFIADGGRRCRFIGAYENHGELVDQRNERSRFFDLRQTPLLESLVDRLVIEWTADPVNWAKRAVRSHLAVVEIADPDAVPFPGFDELLVTHAELVSVVTEPRYGDWQVALRSVQGIYLIADSSTGELYVGKADGGERILGRWSAYARDGHGGNLGLRELDPARREHFVYSLLRVFGPSVPSSAVDAAEAHFKRALLTRQFGYNRN